MALHPENPYEFDRDPGDESDQLPPDCEGFSRLCEGDGTIRVGKRWLCASCDRVERERFENGPDEHDLMNGPGIEGGVRYGGSFKC